MGKGKGKKKSRGKRPTGARADRAGDAAPPWSVADECAHYAALGCHVAHVARCGPAPRHENGGTPRRAASDRSAMYRRALHTYPWLLGIEQFDPDDYHPEDIDKIPEVAMNDGDEGEGEPMTLTLTNVARRTTNICFVTVYDVELCDAAGGLLTRGSASSAALHDAQDGEGDAESHGPVRERSCTTFIVLCPPQTFVHLCALAPDRGPPATENGRPVTSWSQVEIESDIQPWSPHPNEEDEHPYLIRFPFAGGENAGAGSDNTAYQCTQSEHGQLTHFFHGNYHALDFACPIGTPLYSPVAGVVVDVRDRPAGGDAPGRGAEVSGIAATNLFRWNSVLVRVEDDGAEAAGSAPADAAGGAPPEPLFLEFVHIQTRSCAVRVGERVRKGQLLCRSGSVGFSPEPHLHLAAYRSDGHAAATVRVRFEGAPSPGPEPAPAGGGRTGGTGPAFLPRAGAWYARGGRVRG